MCVGRSGEDLAVKIMSRDYKIRSIWGGRRKGSGAKKNIAGRR